MSLLLPNPRTPSVLQVGDIEVVMKKIGHTLKPEWLEKMEEFIDTEGKLQQDVLSMTFTINSHLYHRHAYMYMFMYIPMSNTN